MPRPAFQPIGPVPRAGVADGCEPREPQGEQIDRNKSPKSAKVSVTASQRARRLWGEERLPGSTDNSNCWPGQGTGESVANPTRSPAGGRLRDGEAVFEDTTFAHGRVMIGIRSSLDPNHSRT